MTNRDDNDNFYLTIRINVKTIIISPIVVSTVVA